MEAFEVVRELEDHGLVMCDDGREEKQMKK